MLGCGKRGIRTPETLWAFTRFPGVPLKPLEHLSLNWFIGFFLKSGCKVRVYFLFFQIFPAKNGL